MEYVPGDRVSTIAASALFATRGKAPTWASAVDTVVLLFHPELVATTTPALVDRVSEGSARVPVTPNVPRPGPTALSRIDLEELPVIVNPTTTGDPVPTAALDEKAMSREPESPAAVAVPVAVFPAVLTPLRMVPFSVAYSVEEVDVFVTT
jgi:hypothetical protein